MSVPFKHKDLPLCRRLRITSLPDSHINDRGPTSQDAEPHSEGEWEVCLWLNHSVVDTNIVNQSRPE